MLQYTHYQKADNTYNIVNNVKWTKMFTKQKTLKKMKYTNKNKIQNGGVIRELDNYDFDERIDYINDDNEDESNQLTRIFLGKPRLSCVVIEIKNIDKTVGELKSFGFNEHCNKTKNLKRQSGTINMFNTMLKYLSIYHPTCKKLYCSDTTSLDCEPYGNSNISLYKLYLIRYGKGYYEHLFNFKLVDENDQITHNTNVENINKFKVNKLAILKYLHKYNYKDIDKILELLEDGVSAATALNSIRDYKYCDIIDKLLNYIISEQKIIILDGKVYYLNL